MAAIEVTHEILEQWAREKRHAEVQLGASAMLLGNPADLRAWHLLSRALRSVGEKERSVRAFRGLSEAYRWSGDLPMAIVAALEYVEVGGDAGAILKELATDLSSHTSGHLDDWRPSPPAIPFHGEVVLERALDTEAVERVVDGALALSESHEPQGEERIRRFFPLLSSLSADALAHFAEQLCVERREAGEVIIEQGDPGESFFIVAQGQVRIERHQDGGATSMLARLGPGAFFGEMAIVTAAPRSASVVAETEVTMLRADMEEVGLEMERRPELQRVLMAFCRARMLENIVLASPVLRRVPRDRRSDLLALFSEAAHSKGTVIVKEGEDSEGLFLLVAGDVEVTGREQGEVLTLARLSPGDFFGEISLVLRRPAVATVTASSETVSVLLRRESFLDVVRDHPALLAELYETAVKREAETSSILAREAEDAEDLILL